MKASKRRSFFRISQTHRKASGALNVLHFRTAVSVWRWPCRSSSLPPGELTPSTKCPICRKLISIDRMDPPQKADTWDLAFFFNRLDPYTPVKLPLHHAPQASSPPDTAAASAASSHIFWPVRAGARDSTGRGRPLDMLSGARAEAHTSLISH